MAIAYIFHFHVVRVDFGLVLGDVRDSGLGISLFRFLQVPSKVPDGLMQVNGVVCFRDWGLFWAILVAVCWFRPGEQFWAIFLSHPLESAWIAILGSGNLATFVRDQSVNIEIGSQNADEG